jgi:hypothetical protein
MSAPRYPDVQVKLIGHDGNAFAIMATVINAMKSHRLPKSEVEAFRREAMSGDYDNLLRTVTRWVSLSERNVHEEDDDE